MYTGTENHLKKNPDWLPEESDSLLAFCQETPSEHLVNCNIKGDRKMHSGIKKKEEGAPFNLNLLDYEFEL